MLYPLSQSDNPGSIALIACTGMHGEKWSPLTDWHTQGSRQVPQVPAVYSYCTYRPTFIHYLSINYRLLLPLPRLPGLRWLRATSCQRPPCVSRAAHHRAKRRAEVWCSLPMLGPCAQRQRYATACCAYRPTFIRCLSIHTPPPPPPL